MTALELIQSVCATIGNIAVPNSVASSNSSDVRQMVALLNREGQELASRYPWQALVREASFTTSATEDQGSIEDIVGGPSAGFAYVLNETMWNRDRREPVCGPRSAIDWQILKTFDLSGPFVEYRIRGNRLLFTPPPAAGEQIVFEYVSEHWVVSAQNELKGSVTADDDTFLLSPKILRVGLEWRWRKAKGLSYAEDFRSYETMVADAMARDGSKRRLSLAESHGALQRRIAISPGSWPLP